jgi:hypothetical protein
MPSANIVKTLHSCSVVFNDEREEEKKLFSVINATTDDCLSQCQKIKQMIQSDFLELLRDSWPHRERKDFSCDGHTCLNCAKQAIVVVVTQLNFPV